MSINEQIIDEAYHRLAKARWDAWQSAERLAMRRTELLRSRAAKVVAGEIEGRNDAERESRARVVLKDEYAAVELAELEERRAGIAVEMCRVEIERIQTVLRYMSVIKADTQQAS